MHATLPLLEISDFPSLYRDRLDTLQVNLGYRCNQQCLHCHVNANPKRKEMMTAEVIEDVIRFLSNNSIKTLDLTGGAPELNPHFRYLVTEAVKLGVHVMDRCNLTILLEPGQEDLADFLAQHQVEVVASLPCYLEENVDGQRGKGVFEKSIQAIRLLNRLGYGMADSRHTLNLVYNPVGAALPPAQQALESDYKRELANRFGIHFNRLFTLANMPIKRFGSQLVSQGTFTEYLNLLKSSYSDANLTTVMCKSLLSVDWRGYLYDCDFNQMLDLPLQQAGRPYTRLNEINAAQLNGLPVIVADHCYGCTAGQGSSCGGALS
ncbi:MAG: arsenosugar biosynthesis radical SAM protein ArsS [Gammaproteobacteria bacterium]|nr:arsenosugar biosynthesis radical SAM protein ArsS [Gammaproteobacteria bacterium]MDH5652740.1 arsenosugar biosynthesis radical SAM protein ArsS [Gammaproteobacteria bacterium]